MKNSYSEIEKEKYVQLHLAGTNAKDLCREFGLSQSSLYKWIQDYRPIETPSGEYVTAKRLYELEKRLARVKRENEILRKSGCIPQSSLEQKIAAILRMKDEYNIHVLCDTLGVRRSTVYHHLNRKPKQTKFQTEDIILKQRIKQIFEDSGQRFGTKKIRIKLMEEGFTVSPKRISRLMKELNIQCVSKNNPSQRSAYIFSQFTKNHLRQHFKQDAPNKAWVSDVTEVQVNKVTYYICVIIDLYSRSVITYRTSTSNDTDLICGTFLEAYNIRNILEQLIFHSDRGSPYMSYTFKQLLRDCNVIQSLSKPGYPYDNAVAESFFATFKTEELSRHIYNSVEELKSSVHKYIDFFNNERPHQTINYLTPFQMEERYYTTKRLAIV